VLHFFFFSVSIPFEGTFGDEPKRPSLPLVDAAAMLRTALEERANWDTALPRGAGPLATLAGRTADADVIVAHPLGRLAVGQHALPFEVEITRVGGARTTPDRFTFPSVRIGTSEAVEPVPLRSPFAAGQFLDLGNDERFTRPAFEPMISGFEVSAAGTTFGAAQVADLHYEEIPIGPDGRLAEPSPGQPPLPTIVAHGALLGAAATSALRRDETATRMRTSATTVQVVNVPPQVVNADTLRPVTVPGLDSAATFTEMAQGLTRHLAGGAAAEQPLAIVGAHEAHAG